MREASPPELRREMMMTNRINIVGLHKAELFAVLYNGLVARGVVPHDKDITVQEATVLMRNRPKNPIRLDGQAMKLDVSGAAFDPTFYDNYFGPGTAQRLIDELRATKKERTCTHDSNCPLHLSHWTDKHPYNGDDQFRAG